ncbi:hypothetical protein L6773_10940 [Rhodohalobacter sp. WB101]|uniref:Uncharacterized protein n=1 Tax=Rhodohalobacter sulfatireducens TaxID=2911366 RepID=A0ABS9KE28_9BACT|nr:hypothetical protein [Rhodohalobacter sulfatireducens]
MTGLRKEQAESLGQLSMGQLPQVIGKAMSKKKPEINPSNSIAVFKFLLKSTTRH